MDKPISLSMKEYIIRKMAVKMMISEKTLETVVNHQFNSANSAMKEHNSVEISGFGKFLFNYKKAVKKMEKLCSQKAWFEKVIEDPSFSEQKKRSARMKLASVETSIVILKPKVYEDKTSVGGVEEQHDSTISSEGTDKENE